MAYLCICIEAVKRRGVWAIDKWLWVICNFCCLKQLYHYKELKNKAVSSFENIVSVSMCFLVTYSCDFEWNHVYF